MVNSRNSTDPTECILKISNVRCSIRNFLEVIDGERYIGSSCDGEQVEYLSAIRHVKHVDFWDVLHLSIHRECSR